MKSKSIKKQRKSKIKSKTKRKIKSRKRRIKSRKRRIKSKTKRKIKSRKRRIKSRKRRIKSRKRKIKSRKRRNKSRKRVNKKGTVSCKGRASFSSQAILTLKDLLNEKKERSGKLIMRENKPLFVIDVDIHRTKVGKQGETDSVDYRYTYHTHPRQSYINNDTDLGFPSSSDFEVFIESFIDFQNIFHVLC